MRLREFLDCANADVVIEYDDSFIKIGQELLGDELEIILTREFLNCGVYSVSVVNDYFNIVLTHQ